MTMRNLFYFLICSIIMNSVLFAGGTNQAPQPNILLILTDDIGWGDFKCYNPESKIDTPTIDRLASTGMKFTAAHSTAAVCAPTRYSILTGNYPWRGKHPEGTWGWYGETQFLPGQKTFGNLLQSAGYRTAMFGKSNLGLIYEKMISPTQPDFTSPLLEGPIQWGFDYSFIISIGHMGRPYFYLENNRIFGDTSKITELKKGQLNGGEITGDGPGMPDWDSSLVGRQLTEKAIAFLDDHLAKNKKEGKERPFLIHFNTDGSHEPYTPPETLFGKPLRGHTKMTAKTDMIYEVDIILDKFINVLKERGLYEKTLIILTSDNGGIINTHEKENFGHDAVGGLKGGKTEIWEGGTRVPFIVHWGDDTVKGSKIKPNSVSNQLIGIHDVVPTFCELAGIDPGEDQALDSVSLMPILLGKQDESKPIREFLLIQPCHTFDAFTARVAEFNPTIKGLSPQEAHKKWITYINQRAQRSKKEGFDGIGHALIKDHWKLFLDLFDKSEYLVDLASDPSEKNNLLDKPQGKEKITELETLYQKIRHSKRTTPVLNIRYSY
jgi:arylsulfatase A-like enzyme